MGLIVDRFGCNERFFLVVREDGNTFGAHSVHEQIEGNAERIHPDAFGEDKGAERQPVCGDRCVCALTAQKDDDGRNDEGVKENGEDPAQSDLERCCAFSRVLAEGNADKIGANGCRECHKGADRQVIDEEGRCEVGEQTSDVKRGDSLREEERQNGERFGGPHLEDAERDGREGIGQCNVQRGNDARAADAFGGEKVSEDEKTSVFLFGSVDRKPSVRKVL